MKMKKRKYVVLVLSLCVVAAAGTAYYHCNSKTSEEYAEYYTKKWMELLNQKDEIAFNIKDPDRDPQELVNKWGTFLVRIKEVRPYLDGYKITFSVRNLSNITFQNPKVKLRWTYLRKEHNPNDILEMPKEYCGQWNKKYEKEMKDWSLSFQEKEFLNLNDLEPKSWTDLEFSILPCKADRFEHVEFSIVG